MLVLLPRLSRRQYLITYTQADESKFSTRERFGKMLEAAFNGDTNLVKGTIAFVPEKRTKMMTFTIIAQ